MNAHAPEAFPDKLVATSSEARALAETLKETGHLELASLWERFAAFLQASESYVGLIGPY